MAFTTKNKNAIKNVLFVFEHLPLSQEVLKDVAENSTLQEALSEFPRRSLMQGMKIAFNQDVSFTSPSPQFLNGVSFERFGPNGELEAGISIQENVTIIICGTYERWTEVWTRISGYLNVLLPYVLSKTTVINTVLQYNDEFESAGDKSQFDIAEVISDSRYFAQSVISARGNGHSHAGFFEAVDGVQGKVLHNVNLNISEAPKHFSIQLACAHKAHLENHLSGIKREDFSSGGAICNLFDSLHKKHQSVLGDILSKEAKVKIGFGE